MQVVMIRHAPAEEREAFASTGQPDELRPLSKKGIAKMRHAIQGLQTIVPRIETIVTSPLKRAQETAELLLQVYSYTHYEQLPALAPLSSGQTVLKYLQDYAQTSHTIALIGHEPDLGQLATWWLTGHSGPWLPLKKGGICLVEFPNEVQAGQATLSWLLTPKQLRGLAT